MKLWRFRTNGINPNKLMVLGIGLCVFCLGFFGVKRNLRKNSERATIGVEIESISVLSGSDTLASNGDTLLKIDILVQNVGATSYKYSAWNDGGFGFGANLVDDNENSFPRTQSGRWSKHRKLPLTVKPNSAIKDSLFFRLSGGGLPKCTLYLRSMENRFEYQVGPLSAVSKN